MPISTSDGDRLSINIYNFKAHQNIACTWSRREGNNRTHARRSYIRTHKSAFHASNNHVMRYRGVSHHYSKVKAIKIHRFIGLGVQGQRTARTGYNAYIGSHRTTSPRKSIQQLCCTSCTIVNSQVVRTGAFRGHGTSHLQHPTFRSGQLEVPLCVITIVRSVSAIVIDLNRCHTGRDNDILRTRYRHIHGKVRIRHKYRRNGDGTSRHHERRRIAPFRKVDTYGSSVSIHHKAIKHIAIVRSCSQGYSLAHLGSFLITDDAPALNHRRYRHRIGRDNIHRQIKSRHIR